MTEPAKDKKKEEKKKYYLGIVTKEEYQKSVSLCKKLAEKDANREEMIKHILECEEQGYDMTAYKLDYGLITEEEAEAIEAAKAKEEGERIMEEAVEKDRKMVRACGVGELGEDGRPKCNRECHICTHTHCPFRNK